jgi:hypothetical protein
VRINLLWWAPWGRYRVRAPLGAIDSWVFSLFSRDRTCGVRLLGFDLQLSADATSSGLSLAIML